MRLAVLDASVFVAACSPAEVHHDEARAMMDSVPPNRPFLVPAVFRIEVLSALARRKESDFFLDAADALITGPRFFACPLDEALVACSVEVARRARCRAYDAVYGALALSREAALLTLDEELRELLAQAYPAGIRFS
jgi:predicted nucleic acid-binding protein